MDGVRGGSAATAASPGRSGFPARPEHRERERQTAPKEEPSREEQENIIGLHAGRNARKELVPSEQQHRDIVITVNELYVLYQRTAERSNVDKFPLPNKCRQYGISHRELKKLRRHAEGQSRDESTDTLSDFGPGGGSNKQR